MHGLFLTLIKIKQVGRDHDHQWDDEGTPERGYHDNDSPYAWKGDEVAVADCADGDNDDPDRLEEGVEVHEAQVSVVDDLENPELVSEDKGGQSEQREDGDTWLLDDQTFDGESDIRWKTIGITIKISSSKTYQSLFEYGSVYIVKLKMALIRKISRKNIIARSKWLKW